MCIRDSPDYTAPLRWHGRPIPYGALIQATDGNLYGTTCGGSGSEFPCGSSGVGYGTVFKITPNGTLTTLYSFCSESGCADGAFPEVVDVYKRQL